MLALPKMYLGGLFKTIPITSFMSGIASVGLVCGPGITPLIDSIAGGSETGERDRWTDSCCLQLGE